MGWFGKTTTIAAEDTTHIALDGVLYPLDFSGDDYVELAKIENLFNIFITEEIDLYTRSNDPSSRAEYLLFYQLSLTSPRGLADMVHMRSLSKTLTDTHTSKSAARFMDIVQTIHLTVNRHFLLALKGRFLQTVLTPIMDDAEILQRESAWSLSFQQLPWLYLLPIFIHTVQVSEAVSKHNATERSRRSGVGATNINM